MPIFSGAQRLGEREWAQTEAQAVASEHKETLFAVIYCDSAWMLAQVTQRSCGISISGDPLSLSGHSPGKRGKPALATHALSKVIRMGDLQRYTPTSVILWICDKQCWIIRDHIWPRVSINDNLLKAFVHWSVWVSTSAVFSDGCVLF